MLRVVLAACLFVLDPESEIGRFLGLCGDIVVESKDKGSRDAQVCR